MQPDICIKCSNKKALDSLRHNIKKIRDSKDNNILTERYEPIDLNLNISIKMTSNVYEYQKLKVDGLEKELKDNKSSAIIVSHDIDLAIEYADKIVYIEKKKTVIKKENLNDEDFFFGRISNETIYKKSKGIWSCHSKNHDDKSLKELIQERFIEAQYLSQKEEEKWKKRILRKK